MYKLGQIGSFSDIMSAIDNDIKGLDDDCHKWQGYFLYLHEAGQADNHRHHKRGDDVNKGPEHEMAHFINSMIFTLFLWTYSRKILFKRISCLKVIHRIIDSRDTSINAFDILLRGLW